MNIIQEAEACVSHRIFEAEFIGIGNHSAIYDVNQRAAAIESP